VEAAFMPKTLLLADDSKTIQQAVSMTFAREDLQISAVDDGEAALQAAKQSKPDVILADVSMPKLGGYELCQRVRADAGLKDVPVLLLGGPTPIDPAKAMAVGANGHMPKPFDSAKLIEHVKTILANPRAKPAIAAAAGAAVARPVAAPARPSIPPAPPKPSVSPGAAGGTMVMARPPVPAAAPARPPAAAPPAPPRPSGPPRPSVAPPAAARPAAPAASAPPRPSAPPAAKPSAPPAAARPAVKPPAPPARPPQPPADEDEDIPLDVDEVAEEVAPVRTPLRPVPSSPHKPALSVVPSPGDGGEALLREALSKASREVIEKIAWEVVPELAETIIREELERLIKERGT